MQRKSNIEYLWDEFCEKPFPQNLAGKEFHGICVTTIDSFAAGCVSVFVDRGNLDPERRRVLENCLEDLDKVMPELQGPGEEYFQKLHELCSSVIEELNNAR